MLRAGLRSLAILRPAPAREARRWPLGRGLAVTLVGCLTFSALLAEARAAAVRFDDAFVFTFIDQTTEAELGGPPFDRSLYASAIDHCRALGAKGVLIKLFLDQARTEAGDEALVQAMRRCPTILQARIEPQTGLPAEIPERFAIARHRIPTAIAGDRGWLPLAKFAAAAADVGFVDFADDLVPLLETYREKTYKSVILSALEMQTDTKVRIAADGRLLLGEREIPTDDAYVQKARRSAAPLPVVSLADLLAGKIDRARVAGRVVVLCYSGSGAPLITTESGTVTAHVFFGQCLRAIFESIRQPSLHEG